MAYVPKVYVGPAGWSYDDWEGIVYPAGLGAERLDAVAKLFNVIEINSTFYGSPNPGNAARWVERVAAFEDFRFTTKLVKLSGRSVASVEDARAALWPNGGGNF